MNELACFAGIGGGILSSHAIGFRTVCAIEIEPFCRQVLIQRQEDRSIHAFPIWDDVTTFDGRPWAGFVDVVSGGFPCQDISICNRAPAGIEGRKSCLFREMLRIADECQPTFLFFENVQMLLRRGFKSFLEALAERGWNAEWGIFSAKECGAPHRRNRIFILAYPNAGRLQEGGLHWRKKAEDSLLRITGKNEVYHTNQAERIEHGQPIGADKGQPLSGVEIEAGHGSSAWGHEQVEPLLCGDSDGHAYRLDRLKALGNAQVPAVVVTAWKTLLRRIIDVEDI